MGCRELQITDYFRLTPSTGTPNTSIYNSPDTSKKPPRGFKPVVSVSTSNYRYYSPELGRWFSRDPIAENGGENLYNMVENSPIDWWDWLGLKEEGACVVIGYDKGQNAPTIDIDFSSIKDDCCEMFDVWQWVLFAENIEGDEAVFFINGKDEITDTMFVDGDPTSEIWRKRAEMSTGKKNPPKSRKIAETDVPTGKYPFFPTPFIKEDSGDWTTIKGQKRIIRKVNMTFLTALMCVKDKCGDAPRIVDYVIWKQTWEKGKKVIKEIK